MRLSTIILTGVIATAFTSASFAQNAVTETVAIEAVAVEESTEIAMADEESAAAKEIKISELPQAVQQSLNTDVYEGWDAKRAWIVKKDSKHLYKVEVENNEDETQNLLFDENGIAID
jgi:hypothetical protein